MRGSDLIGIDTNVLVIADNPSHPNHYQARKILEDILNKQIKGCLSHQILAEYYAVVTSGQKVEQPLSAEEAKERVLYLEKVRSLKKVYPKRSTLKRCVMFCSEKDIRGAKFFDALYAMNLLDNGVRKLITQNMKDFAHFRDKGLEIENPFST